MKRLLLIISFCFMFSCALAAEEFYHFDSPTQRQQFETLTTQLRCLVCQNQNLAESNAPLAVDLRKQIYTKIVQHDSSTIIINYLVARYGSFILYNPPLDTITLGLWLSPLMILILSLGYLFYYLRKHSSRRI